VGDVAPEVRGMVAAITPVPGGVGPVTSMMLASQTLDVAERMAKG
jgi:5,10-methylene-tetrahydrofolate dehydrogenase/methenyl tetrahydrofolate cyclohydrolase